MATPRSRGAVMMAGHGNLKVEAMLSIEPSPHAEIAGSVLIYPSDVKGWPRRSDGRR